jgi:hypothetical protein
MGSIITLGVGRLEIDWGKNSYFRNHSRLFFRDDVKPEIYDYAEKMQEVQPAFSVPCATCCPGWNFLDTA